MKMDVIPGRVNHYEITPDADGTYSGKCYELCGVYHSRMLFNVKVVSPRSTTRTSRSCEDAGQTSDEPLLGGDDASTQAGSSPARRPTEARSDRHCCTRRRPSTGVASRSASRSSGS